MEPSNPQAQIIPFTQALVRQYSPPGQEAAVARLVQEKLVELGFEQVHADRLGNVTGYRRGAQVGPRLLVDAHMDVMAVHDPAAWSVDPFGGDLQDGKIWGRGSTDIKGGLAAAACAIAALSAEDFAGTLIFSASVGEEKLEGVALRQVVRETQPDLALVVEPTECRLGAGQKGRAEFWIQVQGRPAHTSRPELGDNAIYRALDILRQVRGIPPRLDELLGPGVTELIEIISSPYPGECMVPFGCRMRFDRRLVSGETPQSLMQELHRALSQFDRWQTGFQPDSFTTYTGVELVNEQFYPGWSLPSDSDLLLKARAGLQAAGLDDSPLSVPYCTNAAHTAGEAGIPTLVFGPSTISLAHIVDEYVQVEELLRFYQGLQGVLRSVLSNEPRKSAGS
jgi:putative selenium metabolism hydrolase